MISYEDHLKVTLNERLLLRMSNIVNMYYIKSFFKVISSGLCCTSFAKSPAKSLNRFDFSTVQELSSREKTRVSRDSDPWLLGEKRKRYLCAMPPPDYIKSLECVTNCKAFNRTITGRIYFTGYSPRTSFYNIIPSAKSNQEASLF